MVDTALGTRLQSERNREVPAILKHDRGVCNKNHVHPSSASIYIIRIKNTAADATRAIIPLKRHKLPSRGIDRCHYQDTKGTKTARRRCPNPSVRHVLQTGSGRAQAVPIKPVVYQKARSIARCSYSSSENLHSLDPSFFFFLFRNRRFILQQKSNTATAAVSSLPPKKRGHLKVLAAVSKPKLIGTYSFFRSPSMVFGQPFTCTTATHTGTHTVSLASKPALGVSTLR